MRKNLILRNGGSQSPDRWLKEPRNNHRELKDMISNLKKMIKTLQATVDAASKREEALTLERDNLKEEIDFLQKNCLGPPAKKGHLTYRVS